MITTAVAFTLLAAMAVASPVPSTQPRAGVRSMYEGKPRRSLAERAELSGKSLSQLMQEERAGVLAKYEYNVQMVKAAMASGKNVARDADNLRKRQSSSTIDLNDVQSGDVDELYYGTLQLGTPAQSITFDFDTGSSDLWTPVTGSNGYNDGTPFNPSESSTYHNTGQSFSDTYGSGQCSGTLAIETVSFGSLTATNQYFGAVTQVSSQFDNNPASGLCGLAFQSIASTGQPPLPFNLYNENQLAAPEFGVRLTRGTSDGAELTMGGVASDYSGASFATTPVTSQTYWEVGTNGMSVNGQVVSSSFPAAIDTGTTLIYVPTAAAQSFYAAIPNSVSNGDGTYNYPCDYNGPVGISFPDAGNLNFNIADLNAGEAGNNMCTGSVQGMNVQDANGNNFAIVGDAFIKSYYTLFNFGNSPSVGFAAAYDYA